jgi:DNA-binding response OmpR family regulator
MVRNPVRPRILICEDEMMIAVHVATIVSDSGCEPVGPFTTGREGLAALRRGAIDAAILDIELADGASTPLARALREAGVPMIVLSGLRTSSPPPEFAGVTWLEKPVDQSRLHAFCIATLALATLAGSTINAIDAEPAPPSAL